MENSPPFQFVHNGEVRGSVAARVQDKFSRANITATFEVYPWKRAFNLAQNENNAFIVNIARTPEREAHFKWVGIIHTFKMALVSVNEFIFAESLDDVRQFTIAVQREDVAYLYLKDKGFSQDENLFVTADITQSWRLLNTGRVDFVIEDVDVIELMARDYLTRGQQVQHVLPLPDLDFDTWLAANPDIDNHVITQLQQEFE